MGNEASVCGAICGMTLRRNLTNNLQALIITPHVQGASTATAGPDELEPLPCLPGCHIDHARDVATKCCETATPIGRVTASYDKPSIEVTAHSYTEGQTRSAEIQLATASEARFLDPAQALTLAALLVEAVTTATTVALG